MTTSPNAQEPLDELHSDELMEAVEDAHAALREAGVE